MNKNYKNYLFVLLISVAVSWTATAQVLINNVNYSCSVEERINQLERFFNAHGQLLTQIHQQLYDNQHDIDLLRGQIQENQYHLSKLVNQQKSISKQIENLYKQMSISYDDIKQFRDLKSTICYGKTFSIVSKS